MTATNPEKNAMTEQKGTTMTTYPRTAIIAAALLLVGLTSCTSNAPAPAPSPSPATVAWPDACPVVRQGGQIQIVTPPRERNGLPLYGSGSVDANRSLASKYARRGCQIVQVDALVWQSFATGPEWARAAGPDRFALPAGMAVPEDSPPLCASVTFVPWTDSATIATYQPHSGSEADVPDDCPAWPT